jgi:hypothetical protein
MMCRRCFAEIKEGQIASVVVTATFHALKSKVHYALDKGDMTADPDTLIHAKGSDCDYENAY